MNLSRDICQLYDDVSDVRKGSRRIVLRHRLLSKLSISATPPTLLSSDFLSSDFISSSPSPFYGGGSGTTIRTQETTAVPVCMAWMHSPLHGRVYIGDEKGVLVSRRIDVFASQEHDFTPQQQEEDEQAFSVSFQAHDNMIHDVACARDDARVVTLGADFFVHVWDAETQKAIHTLNTPRPKRVALQDPAGTTFVTGSREGNIDVWDTRLQQTTSPTIKKRKSSFTEPVATIPNAHCLCDREIRQRTVTSLSFSGDGSNHLFLSTGAGDTRVRLWDLRCLKDDVACFGSSKETSHGIVSACFNKTSHSDGVLVHRTDGSYYTYRCSFPSHVDVEYVSPPDAVATKHDQHAWFVRTAFSPGGGGGGRQQHRFASGGNATHVWNARRPWDEPLTLKVPGDDAKVGPVAWCPYDDATLVSISDRRVLSRWSFSPLFF